MLYIIYSDFQAKERSMVLFNDLTFEDKVGVGKQLTCCRDCSIKFENEALSLTNNISKKACSSSLPTWLQNCKEERSYTVEDQVCLIIVSHTYLVQKNSLEFNFDTQCI